MSIQLENIVFIFIAELVLSMFFIVLLIVASCPEPRVWRRAEQKSQNQIKGEI